MTGNKKMQGQTGSSGKFSAVWEPLKLVNHIKKKVLEWQKTNYEGATPTNRDIIEHWTNPEACQLYFARLDTILTHSYLHKAAPPEIREEIHDIDRKYNVAT